MTRQNETGTTQVFAKEAPITLSDPAPSSRRQSALEQVLGAREVRCPITDRAVRMVRGGGGAW